MYCSEAQVNILKNRCTTLKKKKVFLWWLLPALLKDKPFANAWKFCCFQQNSEMVQWLLSSLFCLFFASVIFLFMIFFSLWYTYAWFRHVTSFISYYVTYLHGIAISHVMSHPSVNISQLFSPPVFSPPHYHCNCCICMFVYLTKRFPRKFASHFVLSNWKQ